MGDTHLKLSQIWLDVPTANDGTIVRHDNLKKRTLTGLNLINSTWFMQMLNTPELTSLSLINCPADYKLLQSFVY
jgi:glycerophosphoryl diester phosphodiesterase